MERFKDTMSLDEKLQQLLPYEQFSEVRKGRWEALVRANLVDMDCEPNSNQLGVAIAAALKFKKEKRQCWRVPPGMGKSRILAAFAVIMAKDYTRSLNAIYIAFSSQILLDTDR